MRAIGSGGRAVGASIIGLVGILNPSLTTVAPPVSVPGVQLIGEDILSKLDGGDSTSFDQEIVSPWGVAYNPMDRKTDVDAFQDIDRILDSLTAGAISPFRGSTDRVQLMMPETAENIHVARKILACYADQVGKSLRSRQSSSHAASVGVQVAPPRNFNLNHGNDTVAAAA